jgi:hypothetical protein
VISTLDLSFGTALIRQGAMTHHKLSIAEKERKEKLFLMEKRKRTLGL